MRTWKFFSLQPFLAKARTTISASRPSTSFSSQLDISSKAASRVFQFASPRSIMIDEGIKSAARASASSGVCLYLTASRFPVAVGAPALPVFVAAVAAAGFFAAGAGGGAVVVGFFG